MHRLFWFRYPDIFDCQMLRVTLHHTHYSVWLLRLQCGRKTAQHALLLLLSSNLHGLGFTSIASYQSTEKPRCSWESLDECQGSCPHCYKKSSSVHSRHPCCFVFSTFALWLPAVPLVLTVNQISLLPSCEPYFCLMTLPFQKGFFFFKVLTYIGNCKWSPQLDFVI